MWTPGARCFCEELMFQPGPAGAEVEDDGFLLGMYFDAGQERSCLVVRGPALLRRTAPDQWAAVHDRRGLLGMFSDNGQQRSCLVVRPPDPLRRFGRGWLCM